MKVQFDSQGNLTFGKIAMSWEDFEMEFYRNISISTTRKRLLVNFRWFTYELQKEITHNFTVWVNGSFTSMKNNPADLDAVYLLHYRICELRKSTLDNLWFSGELKQTKGLDVYYSIEYPAGYKRHFLSHLKTAFIGKMFMETQEKML